MESIVQRSILNECKSLKKYNKVLLNTINLFKPLNMKVQCSVNGPTLLIYITN